MINIKNNQANFTFDNWESIGENAGWMTDTIREETIEKTALFRDPAAQIEKQKSLEKKRKRNAWRKALNSAIRAEETSQKIAQEVQYNLAKLQSELNQLAQIDAQFQDYPLLINQLYGQLTDGIQEIYDEVIVAREKLQNMDPYEYEPQKLFEESQQESQQEIEEQQKEEPKENIQDQPEEISQEQTQPDQHSVNEYFSDYLVQTYENISKEINYSNLPINKAIQALKNEKINEDSNRNEREGEENIIYLKKQLDKTFQKNNLTYDLNEMINYINEHATTHSVHNNQDVQKFTTLIKNIANQYNVPNENLKKALADINYEPTSNIEMTLKNIGQQLINKYHVDPIGLEQWVDNNII